MQVETLPCPQCNAPMQIDVERSRARCASCGAEREVEPATDRGDAPPKREALGMPPYALWLFLSGVSVCALMFPVLRWWEGRIKPEAMAAAATAPEKLVWDVTRPPILRDLDGDGIADLIGRFRPDQGGTAKMRVGAFSGKTLAPIWMSDSLGDWADGLGTVQLALAGNALLVSDAHGGVDLRVASDGTLVHRFALVSPAVQACAAQDGTLTFWVQTREGSGFYVQDAVPQPTPAARPQWCPAPAARGSQAHVLDLKAAPAVAGFAAAKILNEGTNAVAIGVQGGVATLVAFDPSRPGVRWQHPVAEHATAAPLGADLVEGILYAPYQVGGGRRLASIDATTGKLRWDVAIPGRGPGTSDWERIIAAGARVYVPEPLGLAAFDAATGRRLGTLGE